MDDRTREAVRYLGYGRHAVDDKTMALVEDSFVELDRTARRRIVYRIFELEISGDGVVKIGGLKVRSRNLAKNVAGCAQAVLLAATLGIEADRLVKRYSFTEMSRAVVLQACAAAMLEEYLDEQQEELARKMEKEGWYLRPRFSPGYGDFDISRQEEILRALDSAKKIGLSVTSGQMLAPSKSVTAVVGMSRENTPCHKKGCEACEKTDCIYRRNNK